MSGVDIAQSSRERLLRGGGRGPYAVAGLCRVVLLPRHWSAGWVVQFSGLPSAKVWRFFSKRWRKHLVIWELVFERERERGAAPLLTAVSLLSA